MAAGEGRFQHALELTRQLYKSEPTPEHRKLLHTIALGRARQLRREARTRDAVNVLQSMLQTPGAQPAWFAEIASELAACGEVPQAMILLGEKADPALQDRFLAQAADAAVQKEQSGRSLLPPALHADFDRILLAFRQLEGGQDEAMRDTLQPIGLRSPFLEWKVFLRGLQAYHQNDDARAVENWQRLKPERLPFRLAAPLRFVLDKEYQTAQPPEVQAMLRRHANLLQSSEAVRLLNELRTGLGGVRNLAPVFRQADHARQVLLREAPQLVPRLANVFYWATLTQGQPEDVPRYQRIFGSASDDRNFHRMQALAWERSHALEDAHTHWQEYLKEIAAHPNVWPGETGKRARALIWQHMGHNATSIPHGEQLKKLPPFLRNHPDRPEPLKPGPEECYRASISLAPDQAEPYLVLFHYLKEQNKEAKAIQVGRDLLKRQPDNFEMLNELGTLLLSQKHSAEAVKLFEQALKSNPLDRSLRSRVSTAHLFHARSLAESGEYDAARGEYQASLEQEVLGRAAILCKWAACEFKAGAAARGEELVKEAQGIAGSELSLNFSMVVEAIRLKLAPAFKKRFDKAFGEGLKQPPEPLAAALLADTVASHRNAGIDYHGQKTHEKKVIDYLKKAIKCAFTEEQMERVCQSLLSLDAYRLSQNYLTLGQKTFKENPMFWLLEAELEINRGEGVYHHYSVSRLLDFARQRAEKLPHGPRRDGLLDRIHTHAAMIEAMNPYRGGFSRFFDSFDGFGPFSEEDEDFDDGW